MNLSKVLRKVIAVTMAGFISLCALGDYAFLPQTEKTDIVAHAAGYNPSAATAYAQTYWSNYNPSYSNYNSIGGDCANFVSQCLHAGGLEMTDERSDGWYWKSYSNYSGSWTMPSSMYTYFKNAGYTVIENPSNDQVLEGNPVLYWKNGRWGHAAICVGKNDNGVPVVAAHNNNRWCANWTLGYSETCTILINSNEPHTPPEWAKVSLSQNAYEVGENVTFNLSSDTGSSYTVGIDDADGNRIDTYEAFSSSYTRTFSIPGRYSCYITTYNSYGLADSERIYFTIYAQKPQWAKVSLTQNVYQVGENVTFNLSSDTGMSYTVGIDDADGNRIDTYEAFDSSYTRAFETPGNYSCYITTYNPKGLADSERIYFTIYNQKPQWAKVTLSQSVYQVGEDVTFSCSSDYGALYTIGIDDDDGNRIDTYETGTGSSVYTRSFSTAGKYSCYITTYNSIGLADSERIYFTIYDKKPQWAKVTLEKSNFSVGEDVIFNCSSDFGALYTIGIDDADGNRIDTYNTDTATSSYKRTFSTPGDYSCYITTYNSIGLADSERIYFTIQSNLKGDANNDGEVNISDAVMLQKYLLGSGELTNWQNVDLIKDDVINVFDLCMLKRMLIEK